MTEKKKRIFINGRFLTQRVTGVQRYAGETLLALDELLGTGAAPKDVEWILVAPTGTHFPPLTHVRCQPTGRLSGHLWEQVVLPFATRGALLISFGSTGPVAKRTQVITVHDASVYRVADAFSWRFRAWYRFMIRWIVARSPLVLAVSEFAAREVAECFGGRPEKISITTEGWQHLERIQADETILTRHGLRPGGYVFAVSSPTPNKNFALVLRVAQHLRDEPLTFVIAGASDAKVFTAVQLETSDRIKRVGYVSDAELKALYVNAMCFVFPSRYEGFGIPPLEAMSCGCPVVVSRIESVVEVCGSAAQYFDPSDDMALASILRRLVNCDDETLQGLRARSLQRAQQFSWHAGAEKNLLAITKLLEGGRRHGQDRSRL
jgi:glycosyltransferase involved in cell wall biosynthesis